MNPVWRTYTTAVTLLELSQCSLDLLASHECRFFSSHAHLLAVQVVDISQGDVRSVILEKSQVGSTGHCRGKVEMEVALSRFLLAVQCTRDASVVPPYLGVSTTYPLSVRKI